MRIAPPMKQRRRRHDLRYPGGHLHYKYRSAHAEITAPTYRESRF
jgi:hypothetical protein